MSRRRPANPTPISPSSAISHLLPSSPSTLRSALSSPKTSAYPGGSAVSHKPSGRKPRWRRAIDAVPWLLLSAYIFSTAEIAHILTETDVTSSALFQLGLISFLLPTFVYVYLTFQRLVFGTRVDYSRWETELPYAIPVATVGGCVWFVAWVVGFWGVWGVVAPFVIMGELSGLIAVLEII